MDGLNGNRHQRRSRGWGGKMKNGGRLFRRPKLTLSCSAEGKERRICRYTYVNFCSGMFPKIAYVQDETEVRGKRNV
jgi:hypothetical protein